jgi:hypothetical protein
LIYGSPEDSTDFMPILDPVRHRATEVKVPVRDPETPDTMFIARSGALMLAPTIRKPAGRAGDCGRLTPEERPITSRAAKERNLKS